MKTPFDNPTVATHTLKNRLAVAPMTTSQSHGDGSPSEAEARWLERLANDGYGIVISCAAAVSRSSIAFNNQLSFGEEAHLPALTALANRIRRPQQLTLAQLCHGGSRAIVSLAGQPAHSASRYELPIPNFVPPLEFSPKQIEAVIDDFATAAQRAARAGFSGIEVHGANGYLQTQFTSTMTNRRTDAWGGSLENRARFPRECVRAIRSRVPADFVLGYRMSFESFGLDTGLDVDDNIQILEWLAQDGISYGHISHFDFAAPSVKYPDVPLLSLIRKRVDRALPLMIAGSIKSRADADRALELGADLVAFGRAAIGNDQLPAKLAEDQPLTWTPFSPSRLEQLAVSDAFIRYMTDTFPVSTMNIVGPREFGAE